MSDPKKIMEKANERLFEIAVREEERTLALNHINGLLEMYNQQLNRTIGAISALQTLKQKIDEEKKEEEKEDNGKGH